MGFCETRSAKWFRRNQGFGATVASSVWAEKLRHLFLYQAARAVFERDEEEELLRWAGALAESWLDF